MCRDFGVAAPPFAGEPPKRFSREIEQEEASGGTITTLRHIDKDEMEQLRGRVNWLQGKLETHIENSRKKKGYKHYTT